MNIVTAKKNRNIFLFLCFAISIPQIGISLYIPSLPNMQNFFHINHSQIALTITTYLLGYATSFLMIGPICDNFCKKKVLVLSVFIFSFCSLLIILSRSILWVFFIRYFQGFFGGACAVIARAVTKDLFSGKDLSKAMSNLSIYFVITQGLSLLIGGWIINNLTWQIEFLVMLLIGILFLISISFCPAFPIVNQPLLKKGKFKKIILNYKLLFSAKKYLYFSFVAALGYSIIIAFNIIVPFWIKNFLSLTSQKFGIIGFFVSMFYLIGSFLNKKLVNFIQINTLINLGIFMIIFSALLMFILNYLFPIYIITLLIPMFFAMCGQALIYPNAVVTALENHNISSIYGISIIGFNQQACGGIIGMIASFPLKQSTNLFLLSIIILAIGLGITLIKKLAPT